jgi:hypothetical protein
MKCYDGAFRWDSLYMGRRICHVVGMKRKYRDVSKVLFENGNIDEQYASK